MALNGNTTVTGPLTTIVNSNIPVAGVPKASINDILFDEQSGPVSTPDVFGFKNVIAPMQMQFSKLFTAFSCIESMQLKVILHNKFACFKHFVKIITSSFNIRRLSIFVLSISIL